MRSLSYRNQARSIHQYQRKRSKVEAYFWSLLLLVLILLAVIRINTRIIILPVNNTAPEMIAAKNETTAAAEIRSMPPWMIAYVNLHKSRIVEKATDDGIILHHYSTSEPYLEWICGQQGTCGGLGDRLYGIVMALYISIMTNRTFIIKDWRHPASMTRFLEPALIRWDLKHDDDLPSLSTRISTIDNRDHPLLLEPCKEQQQPYEGSSITLENNLMTHEHILQSSQCLNEYWNHFGGHQDDARSLFYIGFWSLFRFTPLVEERALELRKAASMMNANAPYIGIHVRTGKGSTWDDPVRHGSLEDARQFHECAVKLQDGIKQRSPHESPDIYIAADNNAVKKQIHSWNKNAKYVSEMEVLHIDRTRVHELENVDEASLNVYGELKVLIDATCLVMSRSKFSYIGLMLSPQQPRCAIMFDECSDKAVANALDQLTVTKAS